MLNEKSIKEFRTSLRGVLTEPKDEGYDEACKVYNGMIHKHPRMIARCADTADVIYSVNFARENNLLLAIRGGGHNVGGLGTCDDGLVIDLSLLKNTRVDPGAKTVLVGAGCTLGDVDHATHVFGMATPSGLFSTTGIAGLTLGGGLGHLTRKYGLAIDNLLSVDMVLADGTFITADAGHYPDLFWAVRGGGGNFGVVTSFTFKLHPVNIVYGGPMLWEMDEAAEILKWYAKFIKEAPEDLNGFFALLTVPPGPPFPEHLHLKKMCGIVWACTAPPKEAEELFKTIRAFKKPALDFAGPLPFPLLQSMFDPIAGPGLQNYWKAHFVNEMKDEAIKAHVRFGKTLPTLLTQMHLYPVNGAASRIANSATAWNWRDTTWVMNIIGMDPDPVNNDKFIPWVKEYWEAQHPYSAEGAYLNFILDEGEAMIKASYGENYERLVKVKNKYDPDNLFRVNHNIKPGGEK